MKRFIAVQFPMFILSLLFAFSVQAKQVVVTIPPLAGMIAPLLDDSDEITVLLKPGVSPHGFQLKPSHLKSLSQADLLITVGTPVDAWVNKYAQRIKADQIHLADLTGIEKLPIRQGGLWDKKEMHSHNEHEAEDVHHHELHFDGHLWMSIHNATSLVKAMDQWLQQQDSKNAAEYQARSEQWLTKLGAQDKQNQLRLQSIKQEPFLVLHDAFQYFEHHYGLNGVGSIRLNPEVPPSLKRLQQLREKLMANQIKCVFQEPQFPSKQLKVLTAGTSAKIGKLDPMGSFYILQGKSQQDYLPYDQFSASLTDSFMQCLQK